MENPITYSDINRWYSNKVRCKKSTLTSFSIELPRMSPWMSLNTFIETPFFLKFLVLSISLMVIYLRQRFILNALMPGGVFFKHVELLNKGLFGGLVMEI